MSGETKQRSTRPRDSSRSPFIGRAMQRREDPRLVTGQGSYLDDLGGQAVIAAFVRSPHAHARILDIDVTAALDVDGLIGIHTYEDLDEGVRERLPVVTLHGGLTNPRHGYPLARDVVSYAGEPVAMVLATDRYVAEDVVAKIRVDYEPLPAVVGLEAAVAAEYLAHTDMPNNVAGHGVQQVGDAAAAIMGAPHSLEFELNIERSAAMPLEGRGVFSRWDESEGSLRVYTSTQAPAGVRFALANILGLAPAKVEVVTPDVGGGFGVKLVYPWPEEVLVAWAARLLRTEVKWTEDRREHFVGAAHERGQLQRVRVGFDEDGRVLGLDVDIKHDSGAYAPNGVAIPVITSTQLLGPYKVGAYRVEFTSLYTNTVLVAPYRGAGRPQGAFCMERTMDRIADELGLDRAMVRRNNFIRADEFPYDQGVMFQDGRPMIYDSGNYPEMLDRLVEMIGWDEFDEYRAGAAVEGRTVGIGLAFYVEGTGFGPYEGSHISVDTTGRVAVSTGLSSQGQGHETMIAQIVADELGVPIDSVDVTTGDTRRFAYSLGTFGSRGAVTSGNAAALASRRIRERIFEVAGAALEVDTADLELVDGDVRVKGHKGDTLSLSVVAALSNPVRYPFDPAVAEAARFRPAPDFSRPPMSTEDEVGLATTAYFSPLRVTYASGAHAAIVEIDRETLEVRILKYCVMHDCGNLINPLIVEGQIHGGVAQGVGGALYERMAYDENGQLQNASFMDFLMPYVTEVPQIEIGHLQTPSPLNALGIKGAGEAGVIPVSAVIASAIEDALGIRIKQMPVAPDDLFHLQQAADNGSAERTRSAGVDQDSRIGRGGHAS